MIAVMHTYLWKRTIPVSNTAAAGNANNNDKKVTFKNCALFTECISEINNTQTQILKTFNANV